MIDPEIIIVGSGPAGCSTALHLVAQSAGWRHRILVLEAKRHPRRKLCGGGLTVFGLQALKGLGLELPDEHGREVEGEVHVRVLLQHRGHVVVVLGRVHPGPRTRVDARVLVVEGLVLVPHQIEVQRIAVRGCDAARGCIGRRGDRRAQGERESKDEMGPRHTSRPVSRP